MYLTVYWSVLHVVLATFMNGRENWFYLHFTIRILKHSKVEGFD